MSFEDIRISIITDAAALKCVNSDYIKKDPMGYLRLLLDLVEQNPYALQHVDPQFILEHPDAYQAIVIATIKTEPSAAKFINKAFIDAFPNVYMELLLTAIRVISQQSNPLHARMQHHKIEHSLPGDIDQLGRKLSSILASFPPDLIKKFPDRYETIATEVIGLNLPSMRYINSDYIAQHPANAQRLVVNAVEKAATYYKFTALDKIDFYGNTHGGYSKEHPESYHAIVLKLLERSYLHLRRVNKDYIKNNPDKYQELALKAIEHQSITEHYERKNPHSYVLSFIPDEYMIQYPNHYYNLVSASLKKDTDCILAISLGYRKYKPEDYKKLILETLKQNPTVFLKLDEAAQIMVLDEMAKDDEKKQNLVKELKNLLEKWKDLYKKSLPGLNEYKVAAQRALSLYQKIAIDFLDYCNPQPLYYGSDNKDPFQVFKENSTSHIEEARPTLEQHRGWKKILSNLRLAIAGIGIVYLVRCVVNWHATKGKHFFFDFPTDSMQKVSDLKDAVDKCGPSPTNN